MKGERESKGKGEMNCVWGVRENRDTRQGPSHSLRMTEREDKNKDEEWDHKGKSESEGKGGRVL